MKKKLFIALILVVLIIPTITMPFYSNENYEKRLLSPIPDLFKQNYLNTDFPEEFESYFEDNYSLRAHFTTIYSKILYNLFNTSQNNKVVVGKNGYLFYKETLNDYQNNNVSTLDIEKIAYIINTQKEYLESKNINLFLTIAPNKNTIYPEYMKDKYTKNEKTTLDIFNNQIKNYNVDYIDLKSLLINKKEKQLYYKYDSHWNQNGALIAYSALLKKLKENTNNFSYTIFKLSDKVKKHQGDLSEMLFPTDPLFEKDYTLVPSSTYTSNKPLLDYNNVLIETYQKEKSYNLLMFRDSFANSLIPMLSDNFSIATYQRAVPYDYSILQTNNYDMVIIEIVERNLGTIKNNCPIIPATKLNKINSLNLKTIENNKIHYKTTSHNDLYHVFGYAKVDDTNSFTPIIIKLGNTYYKTYPVLENEFEDSKYENSAFSFYINKEIIDNIDDICFYKY